MPSVSVNSFEMLWMEKGVVLSPAALEQGRVSRVADQRVLEGVFEIREEAGLVEEFR